MLKKAVIILCVLLFAGRVSAQCGKILQNGYFDNYSDADNFSTSYPPIINNFRLNARAVICNNNGTKFIYFTNKSIRYLNSHKTIHGGDSVVPGNQGAFFLQRNDSIYDLFHFLNTEHINSLKNGYNWTQPHFDSLVYFKQGVYRTSLLKTNKGLKIIAKNTLIHQNNTNYKKDNSSFNFRTYKLHRYKNYHYRIIRSTVQDNFSNRHLDTNRSLKIYDINNGNIKQTDSIKIINPALLFKTIVPIPIDKRSYRDYALREVGLSFQQDKLFYTIEVSLCTTIGLNYYKIINYQGLYMVNLNPKTGKVISQPKMLWESERYNSVLFYKYKSKFLYLLPKKREISFFIHSTISPNDSILYFNIYNAVFNDKPSYTYKSGYSRLYSWNFRTNTNFKPTLIKQYKRKEQYKDFDDYIYNIFLNPYGKVSYNTKNSINTTVSFFNLNETNKPKGKASTFTNIKVLKRSNTHISPHLYDYIRLHPYTIDYTCGAKVQIHQNSDLSLGMDKFTWYYTTEDGTMDSTVGFEPTFNYTKDGDYLFKIHGTCSGKDYAEWYIDTFKVRIPKQPIPNFSVSKTKICKNLAVHFLTKPITDSVKYNKKEQYLWNFGDGNSSKLKNPSHTYRTAGTYTVSLYYHNGFCDSTLVKTKYIQVIEAPNPGFEISDSVGCSPFTVRIIDTVKLNVSKKEYYFYDNKQWQTIPIATDKFSHTFTKTGEYWIVQVLHGSNGCTIRTDSVLVNVTQGISKANISHMANATYQTNKTIKLTWKTLSRSNGYLLYRNGAQIYKGKNTHFTDSIPEPAEYTYYVLAYDSCQSTSTAGRIAKPIYLTGHIKGKNKYALLRHTAYRQWQNGVKEYEVNIEENKVSSLLKIQKTNQNITDNNFLEKDKLQKCYQIVAKEKGTGLESKSNTLCLPYLPLIHIPNVFTPNNDGLNDVFKPTTYGVHEYEITIINRWGQIVYNGKNGYWDGTFQGKTVMNGAYTYIISFLINEQSFTKTQVEKGVVLVNY